MCIGCSAIPTNCKVVDIFPGGIELESGDIIVARSGGFLAASMASLGKPNRVHHMVVREYTLKTMVAVAE